MQFAFNFIHQKDFKEEDFIISYCNLEAYKSIKNCFNWPDKRLLLLGAEGSGKSHLAKIFASQLNASYLSLKDQEIEESTAWIMEDIDKLENEERLFHVINYAKENAITLLLTASTLPRFHLKDLQSRINATLKIVIKRPDDELLQALLLRHFMDRQLVVSQEVMDYIFTRSERSFEYIRRLVGNIDRLSLEEKRNVTVPLVRKVLEKYMPENLEDED
jgi:chromosomal replication initiation ATPase DnaA